MSRRIWRDWAGPVAVVLLGLLTAPGCRSTSVARRGVTSVEPASAAKRPSVLQTVAEAKRDPNPQVVPTSFAAPAAGGDCKH